MFRKSGYPASHVVTALLASALGGAAFADIPNGSCKSAQQVTGGFVSVPTGASSPDNQQQVACALITYGAWYAFNATEPGTLTLSALPSNYTARATIGLFGACFTDPYTCVESDGDFAGTLSWSVSTGQTIYFIVGWSDGKVSPAQGDTTNLEVAFTPSQCGDPDPARPCCVGGDWTGCGTPACCQLVCATDPTCCDVAWDYTCSNLVRTGCETCLSPDCDNSGVIDTDEYGADPHLLLSTSIQAQQLYTAEDRFCPSTPLTTSSTLVVRGLMQQGSREIEIPYGNGAVLDAMQFRDTEASVYGADGISPVILTNGLTVSAGLADTAVSFSAIDLTTPFVVLSQPKSALPGVAPRLALLSSTGSADEVGVLVGEFEVGSALAPSQFATDALFVAQDASVAVAGVGSSLALNGASEIRGLLNLKEGGNLASPVSPVVGSLPSSWMRGQGSITGSVLWRGCVKPGGAIDITGNLEFGLYDGGEQSRYLWRIGQVPQWISVGGSAVLRGTLLIDASGAKIGYNALIMRAASFSGDFKNIQTVGLPPQFALVVYRVQGGMFEEIRATVVPVGVLLGYGDNTQYPLPLEPKDSVRGDFNADGIDDIAVSLSAGTTQNGAVLVFVGTGEGLQQSTQVTVGLDPRGIAAADFDLDARLNLVVALREEDSIRALRNTTTGAVPSFAPQALVPVGSKPVDVATGDFLPDVATLQAGGRKDVLVAVEGDGTFFTAKNNDGTLSSDGGTSTPSPGGVPTSVEGGDIDNDRIDDGVGGSTGGTTIIPGGTSGSFGAQGVIFIPTPNPVTSLTVADATGDGIDDVLATLLATAPRPTPPGTPAVFDTLALVNSDANAFDLTLYDFGYLGNSIAKGDFDGDGDQDLAFVSRNELEGPNQLRVVRNDQSPSGALLTQLAPPALPNEPQLVQTVSIDGNGDDIVVLGPTGTSFDAAVRPRFSASPSRGSTATSTATARSTRPTCRRCWPRGARRTRRPT
ncbi:MAG: FG-GAP repeat domain-containing protein [Planctomycetota bacterium]